MFKSLKQAEEETGFSSETLIKLCRLGYIDYVARADSNTPGLLKQKVMPLVPGIEHKGFISLSEASDILMIDEKIIKQLCLNGAIKWATINATICPTRNSVEEYKFNLLKAIQEFPT